MRCLVPAILLLALAAPAQAKPTSCTAGRTVAAAGRLRIFARPYRAPGMRGWFEYACLGRAARPRAVSEDITGIEGDDVTREYAFAGGRYLGVVLDDHQGGTYIVYDLRTRHMLFDGEGDGRIHLSPHGELLSLRHRRLEVFARGADPRLLSTAAADAALAGTTAYWTEGGTAHSAALSGPPSEQQDVVLRPSRSAGACPGTPLAGSGHVRVSRRAHKLRACRDGQTTELPSHSTGFTISDRFLFGVDPCSHSGLVYDMHFGANVTALTFDRRWPHALLDDGTLVWIHDGLFARPPGSTEDTKIAGEATALAATGITVYWTAQGAAHSWQAAPRTPSPGVVSWATCS